MTMPISEMPKKRIIINSLPKSGTHLLAKIVQLLGYQEHFTNRESVAKTPRFLNYREFKTAGWEANAHEQQRIGIGVLASFYTNAALLRPWLDSIDSYRYILGHIPYSPLFSSLLNELNYCHFCIIRDPRAVLLSLTSFIQDVRGMPERHFLEEDFKKLTTIQQLNFLMNGGYAPQVGLPIRNFTEVYRSIQAWHDDSHCLMVRFEDLIGPQGGGTAIAQQETIKKIANHLGITLDHQKSYDSYDRESRTFRIGKIDGWKDSEHHELIAEYCEKICKIAGYE